ncbi:hypothetical protein HPP92_013330 [Vanilla planifolia]|uniref:Spatacsin C-terminal domain-containing protein n=1 Tax=Vanilla planifolia TaxID=51239 RepID=A0A835QUQ1_VANPL|nr:hypothetical protein HPP92_013330 [Vanilla planifolia]
MLPFQATPHIFFFFFRKVVLDQSINMGVVSWESQLGYHLSHSNLEEVQKLLDMIPQYLLSEETLKVNLDHSSSNVRIDFPDDSIYICAAEEVEPFCLFIPNIKVFRFSIVNLCSSWLKEVVEMELARKQIFLKDYWESAAELMPLFSHSGLIFNPSKGFIKSDLPANFLDLDNLEVCKYVQNDTADALHKLIMHYCTQYNFPHFLDLYLDNLNLVYDDNIFRSLHEAAGDCEWAKWLLLLRVKGCEYDSSFYNARSNFSKQVALASNLSVHGINEIIHTVDDIAEGGGEMAALATLMYAAESMQKCICIGSISRHCSSSSQCTLENLRPGLEKFPTLWRTLVSACFEIDFFGRSKSSNSAFEKSGFSDYLRWRDTLFSSSGGDTSLVQMLPCWFPKSIQRLIRQFVQVPLGWQSLSSSMSSGASIVFQGKNYALGADINGVNSVTWEATIQKNIEKELYASFEVGGSFLEQHLHRCRALGAFNHLLSLRASKLKISTEHGEPSRQNTIQSDVQAILSPLSQNEWSLIPSVIQMAILHFDDSALVASCTFLLELCGLSASMLRTDIAALLRISDFYNKQNTFFNVSPKGSAIHSEPFRGDITYSLARALADNFTHHDVFMELKQKDVPSKISKGKQPLQPLMIVLQYLEKASLPSLEEGKTCGFWLSSDIGDGLELRSQQKDASLHWKLVMEFCRIHHLPLSTKYLALLANDNDWVGFLMEAQIGMFLIDAVIEVAAKEFSNPRLKIHILTVLRSMQSMRKKLCSSLGKSSGSDDTVFSNDRFTMVPVELFGLIALCERQKNPGETLLVKAKDLRWSLLAMVASCFSDVSPLSCLIVWLEITAARETSSIKVNDISSKVAENVKAAVEATNELPSGCRTLSFHYNRRNTKRRRLLEPISESYVTTSSKFFPNSVASMKISVSEETILNDLEANTIVQQSKVYNDPEAALTSLSRMVAVLCEQHLFLPLLRAFEMFLPSCSLLPFIRSLQAFSQMRLSEASAHLSSFSTRIKDEALYMPRDGKLRASWISLTAAKAAEALLLTCPSAYEKRCLLQLLAATDFGDGGSTSTHFQRLYWKINLAEPSLRKDDDLYLGNETLDDSSLLAALENNGRWDQARNLARQLESSGASWKYAAHHVTEAQAEAMVAEWKEFLWDVPEERAALWTYCNTLFVRHSLPALQAGLFFLRHADAVEKEIPARELHEMLLLALQWLSGSITQCPPVYPLYLLREIETRVWLLAVESDAQSKTDSDYNLPSYTQSLGGRNTGGIIEQTASIIEKMDGHLNAMQVKPSERTGSRENSQQFEHPSQVYDLINPDIMTVSSNSRMKRRSKVILRQSSDNMDNIDSDDSPNSHHNFKSGELSKGFPQQEENVKIELSISGWEDKVKPADMERAVLSLLEFGQLTAAKQLQHKLSPEHVPSELAVVDAALKVAALSSSCSDEGIRDLMMIEEFSLFFQSLNINFSNHEIDTLQVLESLSTKCSEGCGRGLCLKIIAVVKAAKALGLTFSEAFEKRPIELLQLLSLKAQDSLEEAQLLVKTHFIRPSSIAQILAESFLKGLLAAHRGGYMDSQKEEGPAPLLWRFSDFLKWAELCPSEQEIGHALMRLVMTGQEIPHACEVELLILSHHFYKSSACLDGVDVLVTLAANRVESYVSEGDFSCLARLVTGVSNFHALNFILNILIENGQLELLLNKYSIADSDDLVRGFRIAVLTSLKAFNLSDLDEYEKVYNHFNMKHESASLLESRSSQHMRTWLSYRERDRNAVELLESMRYLIEAAEVYSTVDAGHKARSARARAALLSLQIRIPDFIWMELSETNARRVLVDQSRFHEALVVAEAYNLNHSSEWAPVLWNQMLRPDLIEQFVAEFVAILPLQPSMLLELARFYRAEVSARGEQSHFSVWLSPGGLPAEWNRHLGRSFRCLLRKTRDLRLRMQLATIATGFDDVINSCMKVLDKVPDNGAPLVLRRTHGGVYVPLM